jgi:hypothetical protein
VQQSQKYQQQQSQQYQQQQSQQYPAQPPAQQQYPAQPHHAYALPNANVIRRGGVGKGLFDEEPTRQVDGDAALDALLSADPAQTLAVSTDVARYADPLSAEVEEPTRIGHLGSHFGGGGGRSSYDYPPDDMQEPTRAADSLSSLRPGGGDSGRGEDPPTRAIDLTQMGRHQHEGEPPRRKQTDLAGVITPSKRPPAGGRK